MAKTKSDDKAKSKKSSSKSSERPESGSLATKYRPKTLADFVGQEPVATQVAGMVKKRRFPNTIGLFGESGAGKTTLSRMIARYVQCSEPTDEGDPCGTCVSCSYGVNHPDVAELNMADSRGIDDIRSLIQSARSMPTFGRKRIFILDEVHSCFPAGTLVVKADGGLIGIEQIEVGMAVMSYSLEGGNEPRKVTHVLPKPEQAYDMVRVHVNDGSYIECTADHKIENVTQGCMVAASEFQPGDLLQSLNGVELAVARVESLGGIVQVVYDITVEGNHNYFVEPVGSSEPVLVSNCTPAAFQTLLKPLEEPPEHTMWILATTNPEKLPSTVLGRCLKFQVKPIPAEAIVKRLRTIAKREGHDMKEVEGGKEILSAIANMANGRMRDSIQSLESVLYALESGKSFTADDLIKNYATSGEANLDKAAAELVAALIKIDAKTCIKTVLTTGNARGLINKTRWLVHALICQSVGENFFRTYSWNCFTALVRKESDVRVKLSALLEIQNLLAELEIKLNSVSIDDNVLFTAALGRYMAEARARS